MTELAALEAFVRVAELGGFTAAAEALGVSKSHVSRQVSGLEDRLGARLLNRSTRHVTLTDVGREFHRRCRAILDDLVEAQLAVTNLQSSPRGLLRLSAPMSFGLRYLADAVADFMVLHPHLEVDAEFNDRRVDLLEDGFDLAVRIGELPDSTLIARKLASISHYVCASTAYLAEHGEPAEPAQLREHNCLRYTYLAAGQQMWPLRRGDDQVSAPAKGRLVANNGEGLLAAARRGLGIVYMPDFLVCDDLRTGRLQRVLPEWSTLSALWAVYPHARHLSTKVRLFIDFISERFATPPWKLPGDQASASVSLAP